MRLQRWVRAAVCDRRLGDGWPLLRRLRRGEKEGSSQRGAAIQREASSFLQRLHDL